MRIAIVGPGAMGCLFAALLVRAKEEVWVLDKRPDRAEQISRVGIRLEGVSGEWSTKVNITYEPKAIGPVDLVLVAVKSYDTEEAMKKAKELVGEETVVLTLQNGLGNVEAISEVVGEHRVIGGATSHGATLLNVGQVRHTGKGETIIGTLDGRVLGLIRAVAGVLTKAGLETKISRDVKAVIWSKLIINVGINPLTAITRLANGQLLAHEGLRELMRQAIAEATKVAKRKRIKLIYDDPIQKAEAIVKATQANHSSMLQDILRKKGTEIDYLNGAIVRHAESLGLPTPVNATLTHLLHAIEASS